MSNKTGICYYPFLQEALFPSTGGFIQGRYCEVVENIHGSASCCVPCPVIPWKYGDSVTQGSEVASWISVGTLPLCVFLLLSYIVLPVKYTHRHYMSMCFTIGICFMQIAFVIPLATNPNVCYNEITPKGMIDDASCAFTGSFLLFGGWLVVTWSLIRAVAFHLQVCWEILLGDKFMWGALIFGWGVPIAGFTVMMVFTGVSYRFGQVCHININYSRKDYWIPLLAFAGAAIIFQVATMAYCIHIYLRNLLHDQNPSISSEGLPINSTSTRHINARQAYRRIRKVFRLQWRGVAIVFIIIANVLFFAIVFMNMDKSTDKTQVNFEKAIPWLICLAYTQGNKEHCRTFAENLGPNEATLLAVVILLALVGLWNFLLFVRGSLFMGWAELIKQKLSCCCCCRRKKKEFVSVDARALFTSSLPDSRAFEMIYSNNNDSSNNNEAFYRKSPEPTTRSTTPDRGSGTKSLEARSSFGFGFDEDAVRDMQRSPSQHRMGKHKPSNSFSISRPKVPPPDATLWEGREWDSQASFAPSQPRPTYRGF